MISITTDAGYSIVHRMDIDTDGMRARHLLLLDQQFAYLGNVRFLFGLLFIMQDSQMF